MDVNFVYVRDVSQNCDLPNVCIPGVRAALEEQEMAQRLPSQRRMLRARPEPEELSKAPAAR